MFGLQSMLRRSVAFVNSRLLSKASDFCTKAAKTIVDAENEVVSHSLESTSCHAGRLLSPLFTDGKVYPDSYNIQLVDDDTWQVSSCLAQVWKGLDGDRVATGASCSIDEDSHERVKYESLHEFELDPDFDEIDNMRIRGSLFYKLDRESKEYEEYNLEFHRKKEPSSKKNDPNKCKKDDNSSSTLAFRCEKLPKEVRDRFVLVERDNVCLDKKKLRTPTFNQLTGPYHEPFCLDIYISKGSVRACVVHRVTSKVVAVAHSISKDMKFDLTSRRDSTACAAVGTVLAQRALADDIHDVMYTPRKGERIEGKLQLVLQSIIDSGINVKVKIKQRMPKKSGHRSKHRGITR